MEEEAERRRREGAELAAELRRFRDAADPTLAGRAATDPPGLNQREAAELSGMSQPRISRIERGEVVPEPSDVELLCRVYGATPGQTAKLSELADSLHRRVEGAHAILRGGVWRKQRQIAGVQAKTKRIGVYQPVLVAGLAQSRRYARTVYALTLTGTKLERSLEALHERQQVLDDPTKRLTFLLSEAAVRTRLCDDEVMLEQIDHLLDLAERPHIDLGVIPLDRRVHEVPLTGFTLYDDQLVTVGMETATATLTSRADLDHYQRLFDLMEDAADLGPAAHAFLAEIRRAFG
jgi:transcriptional regulator with XRE-family HTH domain